VTDTEGVGLTRYGYILIHRPTLVFFNLFLEQDGEMMFLVDFDQKASDKSVISYSDIYKINHD